MRFDKFADKYDTNFMGKGSRRFYTDLIEELTVKDGDAILDIGCGTGNVLYYIRKQKNILGYGVDESENMIAIAKEKNPNFEFTTCDCSYLPYKDESMDIVMACMAYHHFPDQEQFRKEAWRVLKPGGSLYICDPRFSGIVRFALNKIFNDAGFHTTQRNCEDFKKSKFCIVSIKKDMYVQVIHCKKKQ
jgi:ubiquinone/menaquinone biosynthesis C-methylase UbiE